MTIRSTAAGRRPVSDRAPLHPSAGGTSTVLTDEVGIMQHAIGSAPDPAHGYCTDDVARALQVDLLHGRELGWPAVAERAARNLASSPRPSIDTTGRFRNFRSVERVVDRRGSARRTARGGRSSRWATSIADAPDAADGRVWRPTLFERALPARARLTALRAQASVLLGLRRALRARSERGTAEAAALAPGRAGSWTRFAEPARRVVALAGADADLRERPAARALIVAGRTLGSRVDGRHRACASSTG